jgi:small subunit ribosomal protein S20
VANHPSALKRDRQRRKKQARNRSVRAEVRGIVKEARIEMTSETGPAAVKKASSALARAGQKGALPKRTASRRIGRLARALFKAQKAAAAAAAAPPERASKLPPKPKGKGGAKSAAKAPAKAAKPAAKPRAKKA